MNQETGDMKIMITVLWYCILKKKKKKKKLKFNKIFSY